MDIFPVSAFQDNYIWVMRRGNLAVVVDPGEAPPVIEFLREQQLELAAIFNTHHHADHVGGNAELLALKQVPVYGPCDDRISTVSHRVREGDRVFVDALGVEFGILEIPAHTRTHIAFHAPGMVFCGDTLFACGCGRLFEGTPAQMHAALNKLGALPDSTAVYCGHEYTVSNIRFARAVEPGNATLEAWELDATRRRSRGEPTLPSTIGAEKAGNPFMRCREPAVIAAASRHSGATPSDPAHVLGVLREWKNGFLL